MTMSSHASEPPRMQALHTGFPGAVMTPSMFHRRVDGPAAVEAQHDQVSMVLFSDELDRLFAGFTMAVGAAAMGAEVRLFMTFWSTSALRKSRSRAGANWFSRFMAWFLPKGSRDLRLSKMHFGGLGTAFMQRRMAAKNVPSFDELLQMAADSGVKIYICEMSMDLLGTEMDDLVDYPGLERCGVATFLEQAMNSKFTLFL